MAGNGHANGHNGHLIHLFGSAAEQLADDVAELRAEAAARAAAPRGLVACDLCHRPVTPAESGTHYKVHFAQNEMRDPATGVVYPPCPRSWPPQKAGTK